MSSQPHPWLAALQVYAHPRVVGMLFLGFSAGLPLLLVLGTLSFWLSEAGIDRATIGHLSWVGLAYGFKFLWSPLVDRLNLPVLTRIFGRRRAWLLLSQLCILLALLGMANTDPALNLTHMVYLALAVAFASATQDIALDAYRIEAVEIEKQGAMAATYQAGYRIAMITAGAGALWIAAAFDPSEATYDFHPWKVAYTAMALLMAVGMLTTLIIREPEHSAPPPRIAEQGFLHWLAGSFVQPFVEFFERFKWQALLILALIAVYRISDVVMGVMSNPFYQEMGFTKDEVATVSKVYGVIMTIAGAGLGGLLVRAHRRRCARSMLGCGAYPPPPTSLFVSARRPRPRRRRARVHRVRRQPLGRHRLLGLRRLSFRPGEPGLFGHAVRAVHFGHAAVAQVHRRLLWRIRRRLRLGQLLHRYGNDRRAGAVAGMAGRSGCSWYFNT